MLACHTQEEVAEVVGVVVQTISNWFDDFSKNLDPKEMENWQDFKPPIYNVWKKQVGPGHLPNPSRCRPARFP